MSWYCAYCTGSDKCNMKVTCYDIRGMIPISFVCHIECLRKSLTDAGSEADDLIDTFDMTIEDYKEERN